MIPHVLKVRPAVAGALFAVAAFSLCAVADQAEGLLAATTRTQDRVISPGDKVRFWNDQLTYEVVSAGQCTLLIQRGEQQAYVHRDEVTMLR